MKGQGSPASSLAPLVMKDTLEAATRSGEDHSCSSNSHRWDKFHSPVIHAVMSLMPSLPILSKVVTRM